MPFGKAPRNSHQQNLGSHQPERNLPLGQSHMFKPGMPEKELVRFTVFSFEVRSRLGQGKQLILLQLHPPNAVAIHTFRQTECQILPDHPFPQVESPHRPSIPDAVFLSLQYCAICHQGNRLGPSDFNFHLVGHPAKGDNPQGQKGAEVCNQEIPECFHEKFHQTDFSSIHRFSLRKSKR